MNAFTYISLKVVASIRVFRVWCEHKHSIKSSFILKNLFKKKSCYEQLESTLKLKTNFKSKIEIEIITVMTAGLNF